MSGSRVPGVVRVLPVYFDEQEGFWKVVDSDPTLSFPLSPVSIPV